MKAKCKRKTESKNEIEESKKETKEVKETKEIVEKKKPEKKKLPEAIRKKIRTEHGRNSPIFLPLRPKVKNGFVSESFCPIIEVRM